MVHVSCTVRLRRRLFAGTRRLGSIGACIASAAATPTLVHGVASRGRRCRHDLWTGDRRTVFYPALNRPCDFLEVVLLRGEKRRIDRRERLRCWIERRGRGYSGRDDRSTLRFSTLCTASATRRRLPQVVIGKSSFHLIAYVQVCNVVVETTSIV
jgi:hypothetical protein